MMNKLKWSLSALALLSLGILPAKAQKESEGDESQGAVYTMSNASTGNAVLVFSRRADGALTPAGSFVTGGLGTGGGLGNQGAITLSRNNRWLFAVNPGSDDVSVFAVTDHGLRLVDRTPSGGRHPVSLTFHKNLLYVLNAGGGFGASDNISGFSVSNRGKLSPLAGSIRPLSTVSTGPAEVSFSAEGDLLAVTEKATNVIDTYSVGDDGLADGPVVHLSAGATPFGFAFDGRDRLFVSEAFGGAPNASALSSYRFSDDEDDVDLRTISASVPTNQTAACWVLLTNDGRFAYVTDTGSNFVTGYAVRANGQLQPLTLDGRTAATGKGPIDMARSNDSRFVFVLNSGGHSLSAFRMERNGSLTPLKGVDGLPIGANGLAAR